jgi:hypothetical protein
VPQYRVLQKELYNFESLYRFIQLQLKNEKRTGDEESEEQRNIKKVEGRENKRRGNRKGETENEKKEEDEIEEGKIV